MLAQIFYFSFRKLVQSDPSASFISNSNLAFRRILKILENRWILININAANIHKI